MSDSVRARPNYGAALVVPVIFAVISLLALWSMAATVGTGTSGVGVSPSMSGQSISPLTYSTDSGQGVTLTISWSGGTSSYTVTYYSGTSSTCSSDTALVATHSGVSGTTDTLSVSPTSSIYYCASITDAASASVTTGTSHITVGTAFSAGTPTGTSTTMDSGQSVTLSSHPTGTSPFSITWYSLASCAGSSIGTGSSVTNSPTSSTTYSYYATDNAQTPSSGCSGSLAVTVNPALGVSVATPASSSIDSGQSVTLTAHPSGGTTPYTTYTFYSNSCAGTVLQSGPSNTYVATPASAGTYYYTYEVTDSADTPEVLCEGTNAIVAVSSSLAIPTISVSPGSGTLDSGQSDTLTVSWSGGSPTYTAKLYSGSSSTCSSDTTLVGTNTISATSAQFTVSPTSTVYYCATVTDGSTTPESATTSSATYIVVNPALTVGSVTPSAPSIDSGQSVTLTANPSGGTSPYSYQWYSGSSSSCTSDSIVSGATSVTYSASPSSSTYYCYYVQDSAGQPKSGYSAGDLVTVGSTLTPGSITPSSPTIDSGQSVTLNSNPSGGVSPYTYQWLSATGSQSTVYPPSNPSFTTQGSYNTGSDNNQYNPQYTLNKDGNYGYLDTYDAWTGQDEGATWVWDFGQSYTGTFSAVWWSQIPSSFGYSTDFSSTWYVSNDGSTWTQFASYTFTSLGSHGSSASPITSSITGTYRYMKLVQYSTTAGMAGDGQTYVDAVSAQIGNNPTSCTQASTISGATSSTYSASPSSTTNYCYSVTDSSAGGAQSASSGLDQVNVSSALSAGAISPSGPTIASGSSVTLTANPSGGTTPYSYQWYTGSGCSSAISGATSSTYSASPTTTTTYSYMATDSATNHQTACSSGDTVTVANGVILVQDGGSGVCSSSSVSVTLSGVTAGDMLIAPFSTYGYSGVSDTLGDSWSFIGGGVYGTQCNSGSGYMAIPYTTAKSSGTDTITVSTSSGCQGLIVYEVRYATATGAATGGMGSSCGTAESAGSSSWGGSFQPFLVGASGQACTSQVVTASSGYTADNIASQVFAAEHSTGGVSSPTTYQMTVSPSVCWNDLGAAFPYSGVGSTSTSTTSTSSSSSSSSTVSYGTVCAIPDSSCTGTGPNSGSYIWWCAGGSQCQYTSVCGSSAGQCLNGCGYADNVCCGDAC